MNSRTGIEVANLGLANSTSIGVKAKPFLFFGSQTPMDLETGRIASNFHKDLPESTRLQLTSGGLSQDLREGRILTQAWRIYHNMDYILTEQGSSLDNIVQQRIFLRDMRDMPLLQKVILAFMPKERPATVIIGATNPGANQQIDVQADFIVLDDKAGTIKENVSISGLDHLTAPYPLATKAGQFIFTTPLAGVDPETGRLVNSLEELCPEDRELAPTPYDAKDEARIAQFLLAMRHTRHILESQKAPFPASLLHLSGWLRFPFREEYGQLSQVRQRLFATQTENRHTSSSKTVSGLRREDALHEHSVIALIPPSGRAGYRKEFAPFSPSMSPYHQPALKAGPFVFTVGEVSFDANVPYFFSRFSELQDEGRFLTYGRVHEEKPIMVQSWKIYAGLRSYLERYAVSMQDVVHQTVYMTNPADYPAQERIATLFYGAKLPPTTVVPVTGLSPYAECELEIELVAAAP